MLKNVRIGSADGMYFITVFKGKLPPAGRQKTDLIDEMGIDDGPAMDSEKDVGIKFFGKLRDGLFDQIFMFLCHDI